MFSGAAQHDVFPFLHDIYPATRMERAAAPFVIPVTAPATLPTTYEFDGEQRDAEQFFTETDTVALLVLHRGEIRTERYSLTGGVATQWISWSVAKSFISALIGIAIEEGHISGVEAHMNEYVDGLEDSAYHGVRIKDVLQMSSGARWDEDYNNPKSDIARLGSAMSGRTTLDELVTSMVANTPAGTLCHYNSGDTQALGSLLVAATGQTITDYMTEKLLEPLGMESTGYWLTDATGMEMAFGGLMLSARDYAKLGELYRRGGNWNGRQLIPADWIRDSVKADAPHLTADANATHQGMNYGYGYQWWLGPGDRGDYTAIGVYNQFVYVDPKTDVVIVKLSANHTYGTTTGEASDREAETLEYLRSIADTVGGPKPKR